MYLSTNTCLLYWYNFLISEYLYFVQCPNK
nr:MAG TPA: hypothetical protein [Caudoviricetes sp.]